MYIKSALLLPLSFVAVTLSAQNSAPTIENLSVSVEWATNTLLLQYDVSDPENDQLEVSVAFSMDGGKTYGVVGVVASGDVGFPVTPGSGRSISCDVSALAGLSSTFLVRLVVDDRQPFDLQALVNEVDSNRLRQHLTFIEGIRHHTTGLAHLGIVRDSMLNFLGNLGLHTEQHTFPYTGYTGRNVIGTQPGIVAADTVVIVDAHYDTVSNAPGADDNGSGVVGVLEAARLLSRYPTKKSLRYIGFDLEEFGLIGSIRYVSTGIPAGETIAGVFNFEMIGYYSDEPNTQQLPTGFSLLFPAAAAAVASDGNRGNFITNVGNAQFAGIASLFESSAAEFVPDLRVISVLEPIGFQVPDLRRSDHTPFWAAGMPAIMLTDGANFRNPCYHTASDTLDEKLNFTFMANVTKATIAAAAQLAGIVHGDWSTGSFAGTVRTQETEQQCAISAAAYPRNGRRLVLFFGECPLANASVEVYDVKGSLRHSETIGTPAAHSQYVLGVSEMPAGVYFVRLNASTGSQTLKVVLY